MNAISHIYPQDLPKGFSYRPELGSLATSKDLRDAPIHRWFYFLHSFSFKLVEAIVDYWSLPKGAALVDSFAGSGTTLVAAQNLGLSAVGYDLSPLAVTVSNAKTARYEADSVQTSLRKVMDHSGKHSLPEHLPQRLLDAFTKQELLEISRILDGVKKLPQPDRGLFLVAALSTGYNFTRAVSDGGWLRWVDSPERGHEVRGFFEQCVERMVSDIKGTNLGDHPSLALAHLEDARSLPLPASSVDAVLTSPPYPNRHDYSRVFHIGLLLIGESESAVKSLRRGSLRSHVEAKPSDACSPRLLNYYVPPILSRVLNSLRSNADLRVQRMVRGYFEDMFLSLQEVARILRPGGRAALVVGNVRHSGTMVPVDEVLVKLAVQVGLEFDSGLVMRLRGNSAQQMGRFGKEPSRETVVMLSKA